MHRLVATRVSIIHCWLGSISDLPHLGFGPMPRFIAQGIYFAIVASQMVTLHTLTARQCQHSFTLPPFCFFALSRIEEMHLNISESWLFDYHC